MTVMPENEQLKRAIRWISKRLQENENLTKTQLIGEATLRFDLNPKQAVFLNNFYSED